MESLQKTFRLEKPHLGSLETDCIVSRLIRFYGNGCKIRVLRFLPTNIEFYGVYTFVVKTIVQCTYMSMLLIYI